MKINLLFTVIITVLLISSGMNVCSQTQKRFKLSPPPATAKDFELATAKTEDFKESCLHNFYEMLILYGTDTYNHRIGNYIIGLPDDYNKFKTTLLNPEKSLAFYNSLIADSLWKWWIPTTYQGFVDAYGLDRKPNAEIDVISVFQSSSINTLDNNSNYDQEETIRLERELRLIHEQRSELEREMMEHKYKQERINSILGASRLVIDMIGGSMGATIPDYYNQDQWQMEQDDYIIEPTLPGTNIIDYDRSGYKREGNIIYRTLPGTEIKDFSKPGIKIEGEMAYPTLPGTNIRDFSKPGYRIEKRDNEYSWNY